jgi:hypothetical protein
MVDVRERESVLLCSERRKHKDEAKTKKDRRLVYLKN